MRAGDGFKLALALVPASRKSQKKKRRDDSRGMSDMLDAIQISVALWAIIVCGGIKLSQMLPHLF
ncbi:hypothetical protein [Bradyrhizobium sp. BR 1432]|uniref:hypothetical protein n=1 Tax=Bradyrhizobium sp. BR 1432 TaxID=3447966 RepID=UPI003EE6F1A0